MKYLKKVINENLKTIIYTINFTGVYAIIVSVWVVSEKKIEGVSTTSIVDTFVSILLAAIISHKINKYIEVSKID